MQSILKVVSGGQTGADRAALDWALSHKLPCGGWCPKGRKAEDGPIDSKYHLKESPSASYLQRTAFGFLDLPWKPGHLRSAYGAICCHKFKPKNQTDDIFLAQILGHKLLGPNASLSVGQSYKDFTFESPKPYL
jgi:hypothetical protein